MLLLYTKKITNRLKFITEFLFREIILLPVQLTDDPVEFVAYEGAKMAYADQPFEDELFLYATPLLFEKGVKKQDISLLEHEGVKAFFSTNARSVLPFDIFAASFYLVSRYEEYLPSIRDRFGRYPAKESLAYKQEFLQEPVVDQWALIFKKALETKFPELAFGERSFKFIPTYDVDSAFAYKHKGVIRTVGGYLKSAKDLNVDELAQRTKVLFGVQDDPYDTFDYLLYLQKRYALQPIFFFLVGDYDEYDKNVSIRSLPFQALIKSIADYAQVGIHPSFASSTNPEKLGQEIRSLAGVLKREIRHSRNHFLRLDLPTTYQHLIEQDITDDHTMGYAAEIGFRAGTCTPFYFYNLDLEVKTPLKVHPFSIMEATLQYYQALTPEQAVEKVKPLINAVKAVNGMLYMLCHNSSFSEEREWRGWREAYENIIQFAVT